MLEGSDVVKIEKEIKNIAHNPLPILDHNTYLERLYRRPSVQADSLVGVVRQV